MSMTHSTTAHVLKRVVKSQWYEIFKALEKTLKSIPDSQEEIYAFPAYLISVIIGVVRNKSDKMLHSSLLAH